ncbi:hypothetical protein WA026_013990 [Henosepilachna vigintioctopunctata]|uniref:Nuclear pore complex protein n=1 Tax=Henosepilachna vigintioctopunctata TaxID=420089 RepID=A0AAW1TYE1_9CUCU
MDNDLERSVRFLEDAVSSTGRGLFNLSSHRNKDFDVSITMTPAEIQNLMKETVYSNYDDTMNLILEGNQTISGSVIQSVNPWKSTMDSLYIEFFEILQNYSGGHDILEVVTDLARCCSDAVSVIQGLKSKVSLSFVSEEEQLIQERNTWRLIFILYQDRLASKSLMNDDDMLDSYTGLSEKSCIEKLFKRDNLIRETQLVIDWLESCSAEESNPFSDFPDYTNGWENTLHQIKSAETIAFSSSRKVVSKLDPDAPHYQKLSLHDLDTEDERRLCRIVFNKVRCGKLEEAQQICISSGHSWRASLLEGWKLYHNPNIQADEQIDLDNEDSDQDTEESLIPPDDGEYYETEGNPSRDIWKLMAMEYCKKPYLQMTEKATIAAYSGNLNYVLPMCKTWEDHLWAYLRTMVDIRVESEIRDNVNREYSPLPDWYWDQRMSLDEVFRKLEATYSNDNTHSILPEHIIQKFIILDNVNELINHMVDWVTDEKASTSFLRFATHLILFLNQIGEINHQEVVEVSIEEYVKRLGKIGETRLVAFYLSKISEKRQLDLYASHLEGIVDNEDRKKALTYAEDFGLNVLEVTRKIVENIRNNSQEIMNQTSLTSKITENDLFKISALDWVIFYEEQRADALIQSNAMIFKFLTLTKLDAALLAFNKVPPNTVKKLLSENTNQSLEKNIKEHLSYKVYLEAQEGFNMWFQQLKMKPQPPDVIPENGAFTEKVAYQHKEAQYKTDLERWKITMEHMAKNVKELLYNVLLFPEGWLTTAKDGEYLRSICIPEVMLLLYKVLFEIGSYEECVRLADIVASEKYELYKVYSKEKLGELLVKLGESSLALLNEKKNPWSGDSL